MVHEKEQYINQIITYIRCNFPVAKETVFPLNKSLIEEGILDSYSIIEVVNYIEEEFHVSVGDDELVKDNFGSLINMADFIIKKSKKQPH
ncbi:MAG: acyl carrier protein [Oligoflexia bacterium]|nr:acyl carrier protein [Oligoflexia bacterium]